MAPKRANGDAGSTERRASARIASQPAVSAEKKSATPTAPTTKKRPAASGQAKESKSKLEAGPSASKKAKVQEGPNSDSKDLPTAKSDANQKKPTSKSDKKAAGPVSATPAKGASKTKLEVGDKLPHLTLKDEAGNDVELSTLKKTVIFAYPKANTGGCTKQACTYRDDHGKFQTLGVTVYGLSNDNATPLKNWKEKNSFPYALLSDPERKLIGALTGSKSTTTRSHFVIDGEGRLALSSVGVKPAEVRKYKACAAETSVELTRKHMLLYQSSASAYEAARKL